MRVRSPSPAPRLPRSAALTDVRGRAPNRRNQRPWHFQGTPGPRAAADSRTDSRRLFASARSTRQYLRSRVDRSVADDHVVERGAGVPSALAVAPEELMPSASRLRGRAGNNLVDRGVCAASRSRVARRSRRAAKGEADPCARHELFGTRSRCCGDGIAGVSEVVKAKMSHPDRTVPCSHRRLAQQQRGQDAMLARARHYSDGLKKAEPRDLLHVLVSGAAFRIASRGTANTQPRPGMRGRASASVKR